KRHRVGLWEEAPSRSLGRGTHYVFGKRHPVGLWEESLKVVVISDDDKYSDDDTSNDSQDYLSEDSSEDLIKFLSSRDPQWQFPKQSHEEEPKPVIMKTEEEDPLPIDVPMQTEEEYPFPLDIVYPLQEIASTSRGTNTRGEAR
ncbi:hypothetical protein Tco_1390360, partial [Tanacetum coccineum]